MADVEFLYAVAWRSAPGSRWEVVKDETSDRIVPAIYVERSEADQRAATMRETFGDHEYAVVPFTVGTVGVDPMAATL